MTQTDPPNRNKKERSCSILSTPQSYQMNTPRITRKQSHNDDNFEDQTSRHTNMLFDTSPPLLAPDIATPLLLQSSKSSKC